MPKTKNRLTKESVLLEVVRLRQQIDKYVSMATPRLDAEYCSRFPEELKKDRPLRSHMIARLIMADTFHMTNILNLE